MKIFIILAHPEAKSFNGALFNSAKSALESFGHDVRYTDLYQQKFNPISDRDNFTNEFDPNYLKLQLEELHASENNSFSFELTQEMNKLEWCDLMIWQFPLWWYGTPAILKGWIDRVFAMGRIYDHDNVFNTGKLRGKKVMISTTVGGSQEMYQKNGFLGDINSILRPIQRGVFEFVGLEVLRPHIVYEPVRISQQDRLNIIDNYILRLSNIAEEITIDVGNF